MPPITLDGESLSGDLHIDSADTTNQYASLGHMSVGVPVEVHSAAMASGLTDKGADLLDKKPPLAHTPTSSDLSCATEMSATNGDSMSANERYLKMESMLKATLAMQAEVDEGVRSVTCSKNSTIKLLDATYSLTNSASMACCSP